MIEQFSGEHAWLSNFAPVKIVIDGFVYPSVEHAYAAHKSDDPQWKVICMNERNSPGAIKRRGRSVTLVANWESIKEKVMYDCLKQKFAQEPYHDLLLATKNEYIREGNTWGDRFWGYCLKSETGHNKLGFMIMRIRQEIFSSEFKIGA